MATLFEIAEEFRALTAIIDDDDAPDESILAAFAAIEGSLSDKVDGYCGLDAEWKASEEALKAEKTRLGQRQAMFGRRRKRLRGALKHVLMDLNKPSVETDRFRAYLQKPPERCEITDPDLIPDEYLKREPNTAEIKAALKAGIDVPGARLVRGDQTLVIK